LPPDAFGIGVAALFPVQLQSFLPDRTGLRVLAKRCMRVAESVEGVSGLVWPRARNRACW
jgi:hypothetical protein